MGLRNIKDAYLLSIMDGQITRSDDSHSSDNSSSSDVDDEANTTSRSVAEVSGSDGIFLCILKDYKGVLVFLCDSPHSRC